MSAFPPPEKYFSSRSTTPGVAEQRTASRWRAWESVSHWSGAEIYNPDFVSLKETLSRIMETHWNDHPPFPKNQVGQLDTSLPIVEVLWLYSPTLILLPKSRLPALLTATTPHPREAELHSFFTGFFKTWVPIGEQLVRMREKVIKGRRPSEARVAEAKFRALPTTQATRQLIADRINEITLDWRHSHAATVAARIQAIPDRYRGERLANEGADDFWERVHGVPELRAKRSSMTSQAFFRSPEALQLEVASTVARESSITTRKCLERPDYPAVEGRSEAAFFIDGLIAKAQAKLGFLGARRVHHGLSGSPRRLEIGMHSARPTH